MDINEALEPCVLTEKKPTKTLPCRQCGRPCVVTQFASPFKTSCTFCRKGLPAPELMTHETTMTATEPVELVSVPTFDDALEPETLTDKEKTKEVPCRKCRRRCVVTLFATPAEVECSTCRGVTKQKKHEDAMSNRAATIQVNPAKLENLADGLINKVFRQIPVCPFDAEHEVELKSICHTPHYGPRRFRGYDGKGLPKYDQETGESVLYQCNECRCCIGFSTQHPNLKAQNEEVWTGSGTESGFAVILGTREEAA